MLRNRNESLKYLDDLMVCRWENEGGGLGRLALADQDIRSNAHRERVNGAELKLAPSAVDRAMSDHTFLKQLARPSYRADREVRRQATAAWQRRTPRECSRATATASDTAC